MARQKVPSESKPISLVTLPPNYPFADAVPGGKDGGARCSTCYYLKQDGTCGNQYYILANGGSGVLGKKPSKFCCAAWSRTDKSTGS